ncbi:MAG: efflux RND transporter periplasmic adaptor subunit [Bryobacterales bacterium]|nr:efflux RND transporter periplasmic adaptor subunit [Bryobacterales bacterium]
MMEKQPESQVLKTGNGEGRIPRWGVATGLILILLLLAGLFALGYLPRAERERQVLARVQPAEPAQTVVGVAVATLATGESLMELPATLEAVTLAPIYSRADGYVRARKVDIGDRVQAGAVLAEIESPDLERQIEEVAANLRRAQLSLRQTEAMRAEAEADLHLTETTAQRWDALVEGGVLAKQAGDEKSALLAAKRASLDAAQASVLATREAMAGAQAALDRNRELMQFRTLRAPFSGVITVRNVDVGALVTSGSSSSVRELFQIAQTATLRVFLQAPQSYVPGITPGLLSRARWIWRNFPASHLRAR